MNPTLGEKSNGSQMAIVTWPRWPPCSKMLKTLKDLLHEYWANCLETWYVASGTVVQQNLYKTSSFLPWPNLSRDVRKPDFCICENKDADQLRGNRKADQSFCFHHLDSKYLCFLNPKFQVSSYIQKFSSPVGNPEDRVSQNETHLWQGQFWFHRHLNGKIWNNSFSVVLYSRIWKWGELHHI